MMIYPKIETVFDRNPEDFTVYPDRIRRVEFSMIGDWIFTEKVDGTNIRIHWDRVDDYLEFKIKGRSDNSQLPQPLLDDLTRWCKERSDTVGQIMVEHGLTEYTLFGEGYGRKIQNGGKYSMDQKFILFDVQAQGHWLDLQGIAVTADRLGLQRVPAVGIGTIKDAVALVRNGLETDIADAFRPDNYAEGIVARTIVPLYDRRGERLIWKLKTIDFIPGKR